MQRIDCKFCKHVSMFPHQEIGYEWMPCDTIDGSFVQMFYRIAYKHVAVLFDESNNALSMIDAQKRPFYKPNIQMAKKDKLCE